MRLYAHKDEGRDLDKLGDFYTKHVNAMTAEGLHSKSAIAAELAWRDAEIERLTALADERGKRMEVMARKLTFSVWQDNPNIRAWFNEDGSMK